jgi:diaminobutyrate-2-oxoglutarate transaminase
MATNLKSRPPVQAVDEIEHESEVRSYCRNFDTTFVNAAGSIVRDARGQRYIDFLAGCAALNYGHNDPHMVKAAIRYLAGGGMIHGLDLRTEAKAEFIENFATLILEPRGFDYRLQFTGPTGTNAIEAALKLARKVTGRSEVIAFTNGFHGVTMGALAATGNRRHRMGTSVQLNGVSRALYDGYLGPDVDTADILEQVLSDSSSGYDLPAAILVETVQGEGGLNTASAPWLRRIADIADRHGALLIVDDIQAGCGRTGSFFSFEDAGITPDIVTLSKSLSGLGLPMALALIRPEHDQWLPAEHNGTFRGNNLAFATATAALQKFWSDDELSKEVARKADVVQLALQQMMTFVPGSRLKGRGMMQGLDVGSGELASSICRRCFSTGLIVETSGARDEVVKILAPLTTPDELLTEGLAILSDAVAVEVDQLLGA